MNHYKTYKKVPDALTLAGVFPEFFPDGGVPEVKEPDTYLLEKLYEDYSFAYIVNNLRATKDLLEKSNIDKAREVFVNAAKNMRRGSSLTCTNLIKDTTRYDRYVEKTTNASKYYLSTGFPELDKLTGGIDRENENMVIAARPGRGKTMLLVKMATAASMQGLCVGIYEGEMTADKLGYRVDTFLGHIKNSSLNRGDLFIQKEYKKYIDSLAVSNFGDIKVITPNDIAGAPTVDALRAFIEKEKLDILFVDQYSLLEDKSGAKKENEKVANISKAIKQLQVEKHIPIISVSQMNRVSNKDEKGKAGEMDTNQIALSDRIGQDATVVLMLERKDDDKLIIHTTKSRDGGDNKKLTYKIDFNYGSFTFIPSEGDSVTTSEDLDNIASSYDIETGEAADISNYGNEVPF
jgi:replicative DNA helicase